MDEETGDRSGWSINLSSDGTIIAIGAYLNDGNGNNSGHVRVYQYIDSTWTQVGQDIDGEEDGDLSGWTVSLSSDGSIVAIGARYNDGNMHDINVDYNKGHVRVYEIPKIQQQIKVTKHILALGDDDTNKLELTTSGNNTILSLTNSGTTYDVSSNSALSTTEFSHIVGLINDNTMSLYIDNTLAGSVAVTPFSLGTTFTKNYLGSDLSNNSLFKGTMAYFKTWLDYKLLTNEITDLYNNRTGVNNVYSKITKINGGATSENNSKIKKIKIQSINNPIILSELQVWSDNSNIIPNNVTITTESGNALPDTSTIVDQNLNTFVTLNEGFVDFTLTNPVDVSNVQGIVAFSHIDISQNPIVHKIRYETTSNVKLEIKEIQLWTDGSNILNDTNKLTSSSGTDVSNIIDNNFNTYYESSQGTGQYIEYDVSSSDIRVNDIQGIVIYPSEHNSSTDLSNQNETKLLLYNEHNILKVESLSKAENKNIHKISFRPATSDQHSGPKLIEWQVWSIIVMLQ